MLILGLCLAYPVSKKKLGEIKILSIILFLCIGLFFVLMLVELFTPNSYYNTDPSIKVYFQVKMNVELVTGLGIIITAF